MSAALEPDTRIARSPEAVAAPSPPEHLIMHVTSGRCLSVDETGHRIWELLESPRSLEELTGYLAREFAGDADAIAADVRAFVLRLEECRLLELGR